MRSSIDENDATLKRVLCGETCSPISFYDFASYLSYVEKSPENLQFCVWYEDYAARVNAINHEKSALLDESTRRNEIGKVIHTFFTTTSSKELNIPSAMRENILREAETSSDAAIFKPAYDHVYNIMSTSSFPKFVKLQAGTVHPRKALFWICTGSATVLLGIVLALILICVPKNINRGWRCFTIPLYFLGSGQIFAGNQKLAFCSHLFGRKVRQLRSWELLQSDHYTTDDSMFSVARASSIADSEKSRRSISLPTAAAKSYLIKAGFNSTPITTSLPSTTMFGNTITVEDPMIRHLQNVAFFRVCLFAIVFTAIMLGWTLGVPSRG